MPARTERGTFGRETPPCPVRFHRSMDRTLPSEGRDAGSIPAESTIIRKRSGAKEKIVVPRQNDSVGLGFLPSAQITRKLLKRKRKQVVISNRMNPVRHRFMFKLHICKHISILCILK